jgi:hypothetical protein
MDIRFGRLPALRSIAVILTLALATASFAQGVRVPGTKVTLSPPEGFSPAQQYPGFERPEAQASIMVTELPVPAPAMIRSMTAPALASRNMSLISAQDIVVSQNPARLLHVRQKTTAADVLKWMLIAGDAKFTIMIVGTFGTASPEIGEAIRRSVLTASWGATAGGPFEGLTFRITPTGRFKLANRVSNMLMFTESGTPGSPGSTEALFLAGHSIGRGTVTDLRVFAEARAKQTTLIKGLKNVSGQDIQVAGLNAYELQADASDARYGRGMRLYQVIAPDATGYYILQGLCRADRAADLMPEFKALTASFRIVPSQ